MGIKDILVGLFRGKSGKDGIWDFLGKRAAGKSRVELELIRNEGTQKLIPLLKPGMVVIERGRDWTREIRMPDAVQSGMRITAVTPPSVITSLTPAELELPSPVPELEPPSQAQESASGPS
jgi:hypothetical protein